MLSIKNDWKNNLTILGLIKKFFHKSKEAIDLMSVNVDQVVVFDKFNHNENGFKYFIGYQEGEIAKPSCIILPQMSGYILNMEAKLCLFWLKMTKCGKNIKKFEILLKISWRWNFIVHLFMIKNTSKLQYINMMAW